MSNAVKKNLAASVRQRLLTISQQQGEPFDLVLTRYGIERLLYRLSQSSYAKYFLLKGAMLFRVWSAATHRPTRDLDLLGVNPTDLNEVVKTFREICMTPVEADGIEFLAETLKAELIREETAYGGIRVFVEARLGNARIHIQTDIGHGDAVTPEPETVQFPALLDFPAPQLRCYPVYTVVAEKLEALVLLGEANSRMKDFYDLWYLSRNFEFEGSILVTAILATFTRRKTQLPKDIPTGLRDEFARLKLVQWNAFSRKSHLEATDMQSTLREIRKFTWQPLRAAFNDDQFSSTWKPTFGWVD